MADQILFGAPENNNPSDSEKIAGGTGASLAWTITLANFYSLLMNKLAFLKTANRLSEYNGNSTAQSDVHTNLNLKSKTDTDTADNLRSLKSNVIEKDSTVQYTPILPTHPTPKGYVDYRIPKSGIYVWAGGGMGDVATSQTVTIGLTLPNNNYVVMITIGDGTNSNISFGVPITSKSVTSFDIQAYCSGGNGGNPTFQWTIIML